MLQTSCLHNKVGAGLPWARQLGADAGVRGRQLSVRQPRPVLADCCRHSAILLLAMYHPPDAVKQTVSAPSGCCKPMVLSS